MTALWILSSKEPVGRHHASCGRSYTKVEHYKFTFGEVARLQTSTCPDRLVADIMAYSDHVSTPAMRWGKNNEDRARAAYLTYMRGKGHDIEYVPSGLHLHCRGESTFLGASSDGHVFDSTENCYTAGCMEIKCS